MSRFLLPKDYLPHAAPMILVEKIHHIEQETIHCSVTVSQSGVLTPFLNQNQALPAWYAVEIMAQTIGIWNGFHHSDKPAKIGLLLGTRAFKTTVPEYKMDTRLDIKASRLLQDDKIANFFCEIFTDNKAVTEARINVYQPDNNEINELIHKGAS